ncbi:MAG: DUF935 family protein [Methylovulum sp.]|uniref:DUF935 domain-containing protein n=1 Tax=Methylovulum sp. TaxID=1916980 RepID=UPI00261F5B98|nr:DUF935 family protein [Methylovulum sp.]MDD2723561.1 DUF935 family protein [Methylovulum sp.]MDD5124173.1 DUF935 family protein [Methylovulum sp.]
MARFVQLNSGIVIPEAQYSEAIGTKPSLNEIATSNDGRDITRGFIPQDLLMQPSDSVLMSKGSGNFKIYEEIARDDQVKTCRQQRELALIGKEWKVEPADNTRKAKVAADRLRTVLERICWDDKTQKMMAALLYGYAVAEVIWATDGSEITIDAIKVRNRSRFGFLPTGELRMMTSGEMTKGEALPPAKFWAFACGADHDDEPHGLGLGHYLYWPTFFKRNGIKFWLYFLEKFGQPTALGKYPVNASETEKKRLLQALMAIQMDSAIRIPDGMQVELLEAARSGTADYTALIDRMNAAISKVWLGHSGAADSTPGKLGGEDNAGEVREDLVKADADLVCGSFNESVSRWLTAYNDPTAPPPKVWRKVEPPEDLKAAAETDKVIFDMGYRPTLKYVNERYTGEYEPNPSAAEPSAMLQGASQGNTATAGDADGEAPVVDNPPGPANFAEAGQDANVDVTPISSQVDQLAADAAPAIKSLVDVIKAKADKAENLEALRDDLLASYGDLDASDLVKVMTFGFAAADLAGRFDVKNE